MNIEKGQLPTKNIVHAAVSFSQKKN